MSIALRIIAALSAGAVFGLGITVSGMINPAKVLNFFDVAGSWDPSLALVMASALTTTAIGYRLVLARKSPLAAPQFSIPSRGDIDAPLILGSAIYGLGWGLIGYCPGGAIPALGLGRIEPFVFVAALIAGMGLARMARRSLRTAQSA